jgi:hypothetical protein
MYRTHQAMYRKGSGLRCGGDLTTADRGQAKTTRFLNTDQPIGLFTVIKGIKNGVGSEINQGFPRGLPATIEGRHSRKTAESGLT